MKLFHIFIRIVVMGVVQSVWGKLENNVCKNLEDYYTDMSQNPNCWHNNDLFASPENLAENHGLLLERHNVKTKTGFHLLTFRLKSKNGVYGKEVVFFQHGLNTDSSSFMMNKNKSLPFYLSHQGYDVWLGNFKETDFSSHEVYTRNDPRYWNSSFHENAIYDLPANFEYIQGKTKRKITYIGHSMGGTAMTIYASLKNREAEKYIKHAILFCCPFGLKYTQGLTSRSTIANYYSLLDLLSPLNIYYVFSRNSIEMQMLKQFCYSNIQNGEMCLELLDAIMGPLRNKIPAEAIPALFRVLNNGSVKSFHHYAQILVSGIYQMFDYGSKENRLRYNSTKPPDYNLSDITIPTTLVYGQDDYLASPKDNILAFSTISSKKKRIYGFPHNHFTFLFSDDIDKTFNPYFLNIVKNYIGA